MPGARVLFVDDEPHVLDGIRRTMHTFSEEWQSLFASGAHQALQVLADCTVHVVVTDIAMPVMDGKALISHLYDAYPEVVVLVLSGHWTPAIAHHQVGPAVRFLGKPVSQERLVAAIRDALSETVLPRLVETGGGHKTGEPGQGGGSDSNWVDMIDR